MVVDFNVIQYGERPTLILKNLDGTPIQLIVNAYDISCKLSYNEVSELSFVISSIIDGEKFPGYDKIVGMRIIEWKGIGNFILINPSIVKNDSGESKQCKAYSLEYELTYKKIFFEEGTYNFWNPVAPNNTILEMIREVAPDWKIGEVDEELIGRYRTLSVEDQNVYDFIKNDLQDTYQCVFDFDTFTRTINVRSVNSIVKTNPVYLSTSNILKEVNIEENTENIFTCLDVNGADGVDIRSVNPMGINKIYNLDYFMNPDYFPEAIISKWNSWKENFNNSQVPYYNLTIEKVLQESRVECLKAELTSLEGVLTQYETQQAVYVEASAQGIDMDEELADIKNKIQEQKGLIAEQSNKISQCEEEIKTLLNQQIEINTSCAFETYFTDTELSTIMKYVKEDSISESSFAYREVSSYSDEDISSSPEEVNVDITDSTITKIVSDSGKEIFTIAGGSIHLVTKDDDIQAEVIKGVLEKKTDGSYIFTSYLSEGTIGDLSFPSGNISLIGNGASVSSDVSEDESGIFEGTSLSLHGTESYLYFTRNATEYERRSVEFDLYEYGEQALEDVAWPTYTFSIDSGNFLAIEDFVYFKNQFRLGEKVYIQLDDNQVLTPIAIEAEVSPGSPEKLTLRFGDTYSSLDSAFKLVDLLDQSISMGKTVSSNKLNYNAFIESGASTSVKDFMDSALDVSKNKVLSSSGQSIQWDASGFRLRKLIPENNDYDPEQIWMINNNIVFTDDNWSTAKMALGKFEDPNLGTLWGLVAPSIVGTLIAGNNLVIESKKQDGGISVFKVDGDGARLYNSRFDLVTDFGSSSFGQISLAPDVGLLGGYSSSGSPIFSFDSNGAIAGVYTSSGSVMKDLSSLNLDDLPKANFWIDMLGNAYFKGTIYATDGEFTGTLKASVLEGTLTGAASGGALKGISLDIGDGNFVVDGSGNVTMNGSINLSGGSIYWGNNDPTLGLDIPEVPDYIQSTYIDSTEIRSPEIKGNNISVYGTFKTLTSGGSPTGYMGAAQGLDANGNTTYGVALSDSSSLITSSTPTNYIIVTNAGVRMQANGWKDTGGVLMWSSHSITVTPNGAFYDGVEIGSSSGNVAVFG